MASTEHETDRLIQEYLGGNLTDKGAARLNELAENDLTVLDVLIRQIRINSMLKDIIHGGLARASLAKTVAEVIDHRNQPLLFHFRHRPLLFSFMAFSLLLFFLLLPLLLWNTGNSARDHGPPPAETPVMIVKETTIIEKEKEPYFVAVLDDAFDTAWNEELPPLVGDRLLPTEYRLENGMAKIRFPSGVVVLAEGPVEFRLISRERIECSSGKLSAVVPKNAIGFRVDLPRTSIVDLGTVFTVSVTDRHDEVQTLQGTVFAADAEKQNRTLFQSGEAARFSESVPIRRYRSDFSQLASLVALSEASRETGRDAYERYLKKRRRIPRVLLPECFTIALKGFADGVPDNTLDAFQKAVDLGADACEMDVFLSTDGDPFVRYPERTVFYTPKQKVIMALSTREIRSIELRSDDSPKTWSVPTLEQALLLLQKGECIIVIEIFEAAAIPKVVLPVRRLGLEDRVIFSSLYSEVVSAFKSRYPGSCVGLQISGISPKSQETAAEKIVETADLCDADYIRLEQASITPDVVRLVKEAGIPIMAWTVNDERKMRSLIEAGVDGILTNKPDRLRKILEETGRSRREL